MNGFLDETKYTIKTYFITTGRTSVRPFFFCYGREGLLFIRCAFKGFDLLRNQLLKCFFRNYELIVSNAYRLRHPFKSQFNIHVVFFCA